MNLLLLIVEVVKSALPLPDWTDKTAVEKWLAGLNKPLAALISGMVAQFKTTGRIALVLPDGGTVVLADSGRCMAVEPDAVAETIVASDPEAWGDGKWLEMLKMLKMLLPIILQILPLFLEPKPAPTPDPDVV